MIVPFSGLNSYRQQVYRGRQGTGGKGRKGAGHGLGFVEINGRQALVIDSWNHQKAPGTLAADSVGCIAHPLTSTGREILRI